MKSSNHKKIILISSTAGSVLNKSLECSFFKNKLTRVVSDRICGAIDVAKRNGIDSDVFETNSASDFSDYINDNYCDQNTLLISFYTKLFKGRLLNNSSLRLINFHPSILPSFPGRDGFGDTMKSGALYFGSTVHMIDDGMDTGKPILQSIWPNDPKLTLEQKRHIVFLQQCKMLIQITNWFIDDRLIFDGSVFSIREAKYELNSFSPNLDFQEAIDFGN